MRTIAKLAMLPLFPLVVMLDQLLFGPIFRQPRPSLRESITGAWRTWKAM